MWCYHLVLHIYGYCSHSSLSGVVTRICVNGQSVSPLLWNEQRFLQVALLMLPRLTNLVIRLFTVQYNAQFNGREEFRVTFASHPLCLLWCRHKHGTNRIDLLAGQQRRANVVANKVKCEKCLWRNWIWKKKKKTQLSGRRINFNFDSIMKRFARNIRRQSMTVVIHTMRLPIGNLHKLILIIYDYFLQLRWN